MRTITVEVRDPRGLHGKLESLGESAQYDLCNSCGNREGRQRDNLGRWIYPAALPNGGTIRLLKVLLTNVCDKNCGYCGIHAGRDVPRITFAPEELASAFDQMERADLVDGLFLSSGVCAGPGRTMDRMIACVELLRKRYAFPGYVHLKLLPGCSDAHVERALRIAQRVSINLEAPGPERLASIAPRKDHFEELMRPMLLASRLIRESREEYGPPAPGRRSWVGESTPPGPSARLLAPAGQTTQFVVGAAGESDHELLSTTVRLYRQLGVQRAYFSAFQPVPGTALEDKPATPAWREHRLYQADWLLRFYGFDFGDLVFDEAGSLPRRADPKQLYAARHPERYPVEVNRAGREELLRVPGLGPISVARLLRFRREGSLRDLEDLARAGADARRAAPYVLLDGRRPPFQLPLWPTPDPKGLQDP